MKIKLYQKARIVLKNIGEIEIEEVSDGFNITLIESVKNGLRIGIMDNNNNIHYMYWDTIKKNMNKINDR